MHVRLGLALVVLGIASGCATLRRDSLKAIDAEVQQQPRLVRARAQGGFRLGPYTIVQRKLREHALDREPALTIEGPPRPTWRWDLELELAIDRGATWKGRCIGTRRSNIDSDFGTVAGVANDDVAITCDFDGADMKWHFAAKGRLDGNIFGELVADDASAAPSTVEILLWMKRMKLISRHLAEPVAQVRHGERVVAAMVLSRPEWAWVQRAEPDRMKAAAMITLAAIRLLPLGFDE